MIRRLFFGLGVLLLGYTGIFAQGDTPSFRPRISLGVGGGASFTRFTFSPSVRQHAYRGYSGGLFVRYDVERGASVQLEANYTQTGFRERFDDESQAYERNLQYIELPLLTHLYLQQRNIRFFVNAGPYVGWMVADTQSSQVGDTDFDETQKIRHNLPIAHKLGWGLCGGPGISLALGTNQRIELDGRIVYGFGDIFSSKRTDPYGQSSELRYGVSLRYFFIL